MIFVNYPGHFIAGLLLVVFAALMFFAFDSKQIKKARLWQWLLLFVQYGAVVILLLLLWDPSQAQMSDAVSRNSVVALFDTSESMSVVEEGRRSRLDRAMEVFTGKFHPADPEGPEYKLYGFDSDSYFSRSADSFHRWGDRTNFGSVLKLIEKCRRRELPAASDAQPGQGSGKIVGVVVFSDGQADEKNIGSLGRGPNKDLKVVFVGVGSKNPQTDIAIKSIKAPSQVTVGMAYRVDVDASVRNLQPGRVVLELLKNGAVVDSQQRSVTNKNDQVKVHFVVGADTLGRDTLMVRAAASAVETNLANNVRSTMVNVVENAKLHVLLYSQVANFDVGKVREALVRDKKVQLELGLDAIKRPVLAVKAQMMCGHVPLPKSKEGFYRYDVIILGPCAVDNLSAEQIDGLYSFVVDRGGGLIVLPGRQEYGPSGWKHEKVKSLVPLIGSGDTEAVTTLQEGPVQLTFEGVDSEVISPAYLKEHPTPSSPYYSVVDKKPAAMVLAAVGREPLIVTHRVGRGRVCFLNVSKLFRWYRQDLDGGLLQKFMSGVTAYVGRLTSVEAGVDIFAERSTVQAHRIRFDAYVRNSSFEPVDGATVLLNVSEKVLRMDERGQGHYAAEIDDFGEESIIAAAQAELGGVYLGEKTIAVNLPLPRREMDNVELDSAFLGALAKQVGGKYMGADDVPSDMSKCFEAKTAVSKFANMRSVWPRWWVLVTLCGVLSLGWFVRRAVGFV